MARLIASPCSGTICTRFCLVAELGLIPKPGLGVDLGGLEQQHLTDAAAGQQGHPERQRGVARAVRVECCMGGLDLGRIEEDMSLILQADDARPCTG